MNYHIHNIEQAYKRNQVMQTIHLFTNSPSFHY